MSEKELLSKDVFEIYMKLTKDSLDELKDKTGLLFHKLDQHEKTLVRNTVTVEDHKRRSENIEERQEEFLSLVSNIKDQLSTISESLIKIDNRVTDIEDDMTPIKTHITEVKNVTNFLNLIYTNRGLIIKIVLTLFAAISGVYYGVDTTAETVKKVIVK